ncbi:MAG: hypothetical protein JNK35_04415 [Phycisphaerae bacterium]|nr:hypothetical protein [Phycisphaerae bacterium]
MPWPTHLPTSARAVRQRSWTTGAGLLALALAAPPLAAQAPGGGDPAFPRETPPPPRREKNPIPASIPDGPKDPAARMGKVDLRPRFQKGSETRYVMRIRSDNSVNMPGLIPGMPGETEPAKPTPSPSAPSSQPARPGSKPPQPPQPAAPPDGTGQGQRTEQEIGILLRVVEATAEDGAKVELVYERVKVSIQAGGTEMFWDSTKPKHPNSQLDDSEILEPMYRRLVGAKMTIIFDATGNVKSVEGGSELALPAGLGAAGLPIDPKKLASLFGPVSSSNSGSGLYDVGEKWTNVDDVDTGVMGRFKMITTNELRAARLDEADVYFTGRIEAGSESGTPGSPFQLKDSRYQGKFTWDRLRGQLKSMESEQDVTIAGGPGVSGGMKAKSTVRIEREAAKPKSR